MSNPKFKTYAAHVTEPSQYHNSFGLKRLDFGKEKFPGRNKPERVPHSTALSNFSSSFTFLRYYAAQELWDLQEQQYANSGSSPTPGATELVIPTLANRDGLFLIPRKKLPPLRSITLTGHNQHLAFVCAFQTEPMVR